MQIWEQEFAWTEADKPIKLAARALTVPPSSSLNVQPMFCFMTMLKMWYWSGLVYDHQRVRLTSIHGMLLLPVASAVCGFHSTCCLPACGLQCSYALQACTMHGMTLWHAHEALLLTRLLSHVCMHSPSLLLICATMHWLPLLHAQSLFVGQLMPSFLFMSVQS